MPGMGGVSVTGRRGAVFSWCFADGVGQTARGSLWPPGLQELNQRTTN